MKKNFVHEALCLLTLLLSAVQVFPQWTQTNWPASTGFFDLCGAGDRVFARTWDSLGGGRMFLTADNGATWTPMSPADGNSDFISVVMLDDGILAGTWNGFYRSDVNGTSWNAVTPAGIPQDTAICGLEMISAALFAGARGAVYTSSNGGSSWSEVKSGIAANARITSFAACGGAVFAGSDSGGVFMTTNGGAGWTAVNSGLSDRHIRKLAASGARLFAVTVKGVFISDNNGANWSAGGSSLTGINGLAAAGGQLFAGTESGVFLSVDGAATWNQLGSGMPADTRAWSLAVSGDNLFAGTSRGVWRCPLTLTEYTITAGASEGGAISPAGAVSVYAYGSRTFAIVPSPGYRIGDVKVDEVSSGALTSYTFSNVTAGHTIFAAFTTIPVYSITASASGGGSISPAGTVTVYEGSSQTFAITPSGGFAVSSVTVDGSPVGAISTYTFSNVTGNHAIAASFVSAPYTITASAGTGGSIFPSGAGTVAAGLSPNFAHAVW
jgi:hypothetical protein